MFKTPDDLKAFLTWAKDQKIKSVSVADDGVKVEFSDLAFVPEDAFQDLTNGGPSTLAETEPIDPKEEEDLLFHSSIR